MAKAKSWVAALSGAAVFSIAHSAAAQAEIEALVAALGDRTTEWQAAAELHARGEPAIAALIGNLPRRMRPALTRTTNDKPQFRRQSATAVASSARAAERVPERLSSPLKHHWPIVQ
jgi:hypothetical protein